MNDPPVSLSTQVKSIDVVVYREEEAKSWREKQSLHNEWIHVKDNGERVEVVHAVLFSLSFYDVDHKLDELIVEITELPESGE